MNAETQWLLLRWTMCPNRRDCPGTNGELSLRRPNERFHFEFKVRAPAEGGGAHVFLAQLFSKRHAFSCPEA